MSCIEGAARDRLLGRAARRQSFRVQSWSSQPHPREEEVMARKVTTTYECDRCGISVASATELQRFVLEQRNRGRRLSPVVVSDFCSDCEGEFLAAVEPFFVAEMLPELYSMRREED